MTKEYILFSNYFKINIPDKYIARLMQTYKIKYILGAE